VAASSRKTSGHRLNRATTDGRTPSCIDSRSSDAALSLNGSTGSITVDCWIPSATSRPPNPNIYIMLQQAISIWQNHSQPRASGKAGTVHFDLVLGRNQFAAISAV
jgi:hypothetical protein